MTIDTMISKINAEIARLEGQISPDTSEGVANAIRGEIRRMKELIATVNRTSDQGEAARSRD